MSPLPRLIPLETIVPTCSVPSLSIKVTVLFSANTDGVFVSPALSACSCSSSVLSPISSFFIWLFSIMVLTPPDNEPKNPPDTIPANPASINLSSNSSILLGSRPNAASVVTAAINS